MTGRISITIACSVENWAIAETKAEALSHQLGLPLIHDAAESSDGLHLRCTDDGLELDEAGASGKGVRAEFTRHDLRPGSSSLSRKQPLPRAIGAKNSTILDATAGLGGDTVLLAAMGYRVLAVERHPVVHALLEDGLEQAVQKGLISPAVRERITLRCADARDALVDDTWHPALPVAVYVDPMFPPKRRSSALPRKAIQILRRVVGDDADAADLVAHALESAVSRVVVKRPDHAPPLLPHPSHACAGKLVRYDVYCKGSPIPAT